MNNRPKTEYEKAMYTDGYRMGLSVINDGFTAEKLRLAQTEIYRNIDQLIDSLLQHAQKQNVEIDCKAGCYYCCHQAVFANTFELEFLAQYIKENLSEQEQSLILKNAKEKYSRTQLLDKQSVLNYKYPCPLLSDGKCMAYQARPMACRIYLSMKVTTCKQFYSNPTDDKNYPALLEFPLMAGRMINEGFVAALKSGQIEQTEQCIEQGLIAILEERP